MFGLTRRLREVHAALLFGLTGCATSHGVAPEAPAATPTSSYRSEKFGYSWTLPDDWEFISADAEGESAEEVPTFDILTAKRKGADLPALGVLVTDLLNIPDVVRNTPKDYEGLENHGANILKFRGVEVQDTRRVQMMGVEAVEVSGSLGEERLAVRLFHRGRRRFEFRCLSNAGQVGWPCESAVAAFSIVDLPEVRSAGETPRVLHLRDARYGVEFDAPDDTWLAIGPREAAGGAQVVWIWGNAGRQIDVQVFDLRQAVMRAGPDAVSAIEEHLVARMVELGEKRGTVVRSAKSVLAGQPCHHLVMDRDDGMREDLFMLFWNNTNYALLISQPQRDNALIEKARKGFRLKPKP